MNFRLVRPRCLVDINNVSGLSYLKESDGKLRIGALTRHRTLENSPVVRQKHGLLFEAVRLIGSPAIRTRGTVAGSIAHADPTAELPTVLAVLDGEVQAVGLAGGAASDGGISSSATSRPPSNPPKSATEVVLPIPSPKSGWAFEEFSHRLDDFAIIGVAAVVEADGKKRCTEARLAIAGVGPSPVRATTAEQFLKGQELTAAVLEEAGRRVAEQVDPDSDLHASREFRQNLAAVMTARALGRAVERLKTAEGR